MTASADFDRQVAEWLDVAWPTTSRRRCSSAALFEARSVRRPTRAVRLITGPSAWPPVGEVSLLGRRRSLARVALAMLLVAALVAAALWAGTRLPRPPGPI